MKIKIEIDCTPEEARGFLGMPDMRAAQDAFAKGMEARISEALATADPEALLKMWMPAGVKGFEELQKAFWERFSGRTGGET